MKLKLLLMTLLLVIIGVGCGTKEEDSGSYEIIWYGIGPMPRDKELVFDKINEYTEEKIGVTIDYRTSDWGEYNQKMQIMTASGDSFDMAFTASWVGYSQLATRGAFLELDELLEEYGQGIKSIIDADILKGARIDGKLYGIPNLKEMAAQDIIRVNKKYLDKYNIDIDGITEMKDLFSAMEIIKNNEPSINPFSIWKDTALGVEGLDYIVGAKFPGAIRVKDGDLKVINQYKEPKTLEQLKLFRKAYKAGYTPQDAISKSSTDEEKSSGRWFVDLAGYQPLAEKLWAKNYGHGVKVIPLNKPIMSTASVTGSMLAISSTSEKPEKVMEFINLLNTDKYLRNLVDNGIEGVHFEKISENRMKLTDRAEDYDVPTFSMGNLFLTYLYEEDPKNKWEIFEKFNSQAEISPLLGFSFNPEPVKLEFTALLNIMEEFAPGIYTGALSTEKGIDDMLSKMERVGLSKVMDEMQKQIDDWQKVK